MSADHKSPRWIDAADVARMIRRALRTVFPGQKFSVRTSKYSGGASVRIRWTDGPHATQVLAVCNRYQAKAFDGMTDSPLGFPVPRYPFRSSTTLNGEVRIGFAARNTFTAVSISSVALP